MLPMQYRLKMAFMMVALLFSPLLLAEHAAASKKTETRAIYVEGNPIQTTVIIQNGYQLVPAALFRQAAGVQVSWNRTYRSAVISNAWLRLGLPVGKNYSDYAYVHNDVWERDYLETTTELMHDRAYVPLAYAAAKLGMEAVYDHHTKITYVSAKDNYELNAVPAFHAARAALSEEELHWFYQITEAEAGGESYEGKVAVAASILNRVESPEWPDSIKETIFQITYDESGKAYYQYSPVLDQRIYSVKPSEETKKAVHAALNGEDPSLGAVVFYNPDKTDNEWVRSRPETVRIGNHIFAK